MLAINEMAPELATLIFFIAQLINVILSTTRTIVTIKGNRTQVIIANTVHYTASAAMVALISKINRVDITIIVTAITNFIGVTISLWLVDKIKKERIWRFSLYAEVSYLDSLKTDLKENQLVFVTLGDSDDSMRVIDIFSRNKAESKIINSLISKYKTEYTIVESKNHKK